jgi:hypothetical protein
MKRFLLPLLAALALPTAANADSIAIQKAYAASILGGNLCYLRQGRLTKQSFVLNVENLMLKKGYDINLLYKDNVRRAGKLIANKLDNNCSNNNSLKDEEFIMQIANILR